MMCAHRWLAEFAAFIDQERARWKTIVDAVGLVQEQ